MSVKGGLLQAAFATVKVDYITVWEEHASSITIVSATQAAASTRVQISPCLLEHSGPQKLPAALRGLL